VSSKTDDVSPVELVVVQMDFEVICRRHTGRQSVALLTDLWLLGMVAVVVAVVYWTVQLAVVVQLLLAGVL